MIDLYYLSKRSEVRGLRVTLKRVDFWGWDLLEELSISPNDSMAGALGTAWLMKESGGESPFLTISEEGTLSPFLLPR